MKKEYIKTCLEDLNKQEKSIKKRRLNQRITTIIGLLTGSFAAAFPLSQAFAYAMASVTGFIFYNGMVAYRNNKDELKRINNERSHLQELSYMNPENNKELYAKRMNKQRELSEAMIQKEEDLNKASKNYRRSVTATAIGFGLSTFLPFMFPFAAVCGLSTVITGEKSVKLNRQMEKLTNRKNNLDNDISTIDEHQKDMNQARRERREQAARQRQTTYRGTPKAAAKTSNESLIDEYLDQMSHPVIDETVKQKIK